MEFLNEETIQEKDRCELVDRQLSTLVTRQNVCRYKHTLTSHGSMNSCVSEYFTLSFVDKKVLVKRDGGKTHIFTTSFS